jgi:hypothetical protein
MQPNEIASLLGLATSVILSIRVSPDQADDLQRLLERVEEIRARDIIRRTGNA